MTKARLKRKLKTSIVAGIALTILCLCVGILYIPRDMDKYNMTFWEVVKDNIKYTFLCIWGMILLMDVGDIINYLFHTIISKKNRVSTNLYIRDIETNIPPAMASLLLDEKVEAEKDFTATFAYLVYKKYFNLENDEIIILNKNISSLSRHERYIYNTIVKRRGFDERKFVKIMHEEASVEGYIVFRDTTLIVLKQLIIFLVAVLATLLLYLVSPLTEPYVGFVLPLWGLSVIPYLVYVLLKLAKITYYADVKKFTRTEKGEKEATNFAAIKKFLHDYTYMKDQTVEGMVIYEKYIPYAIALGEADRIEDLGDKYQYAIIRHRK